MKKQGFVLMETIVVIVVISIALLTIFKSYNKILAKVKTENKYDTSEYIYMTKYVKEYLKNTCNLSAEDVLNETVTDHFNSGSCVDKNASGINDFKIKKIYILKNINSFTNSKLTKFDAYMIDYLRKIDVGDRDEIIIVEYEKNALDDKGNEIYTTKCPKNGTDSEGNPCLPLTETYIASLEWN